MFARYTPDNVELIRQGALSCQTWPHTSTSTGRVCTKRRVPYATGVLHCRHAACLRQQRQLALAAGSQGLGCQALQHAHGAKHAKRCQPKRRVTMWGRSSSSWSGKTDPSCLVSMHAAARCWRLVGRSPMRVGCCSSLGIQAGRKLRSQQTCGRQAPWSEVGGGALRRGTGAGSGSKPALHMMSKKEPQEDLRSTRQSAGQEQCMWHPGLKLGCIWQPSNV